MTKMKTIWILMAFLIGAQAFADDIEVPEEELARETTLPVFNKRRIVLNRKVMTAERPEFGIGFGYELNEPYYNTMFFQGVVNYNFNEVSAVNLRGVFWNKGLSSYGEQLKGGTCPANGGKFCPFDASKAPHPTWAVIANYEYIAYYGKISVTKQGVMNLNTFGLIGAGYMSLSPLSTVVFDFGVGQNFFFTRWFGLRWDLVWLIFQGPDATSKELRPQDNPSAGSFSTRSYFNAQFGLNLVFIL